MNKHLIILPLLFVSATALLLLSLSLPEDEPVVAISPTPFPAVSQSISPQPTTATTVQPSAKPERSPAPTVSQKPIASPSPTPTATPLPSFGIAATTPEAVLREAQANTGRIDPFKPILPPDLPVYAPQVEAEQLAYVPPPVLNIPTTTTTTGKVPVKIPVPSRTAVPELPEPSPEPVLTEGLSLKGIISGGLEPVAIVQVDGNSELVRSGERLPGNILVTSIHFEGQYITLSRGNQKARLELEEE